jgi:hypothetical protein
MTSLVRRFQSSPASATALWRINAHQTARIGDRIYLFKQGSEPRGIFGLGEIIGAPTLRDDPADIEGGLKYRAEIRFDHLVDPSAEFLLDYQAIQDLVPETLIAAQASGNSVPEEVSAELDARLSTLLTLAPLIRHDDADDSRFDPDSINDTAERTIRAIRLRRGQPAFRDALLEAYGRRCAITGCAVEDVLEAAHITPHLGTITNHVSNGLLLRADIHTLFDCGLLAIEPKSRTVVINKRLRASSYAKLIGKALRQPKDAAKGPSTRNLEKKFRMFKGIDGS